MMPADVSTRNRFWIGFALRFLIWCTALLVVAWIQFKRHALDLAEFKIGSPTLTFYVMPSSIGFEYFPEVYQKEWVKVGSHQYSTIPFIGVLQEKMNIIIYEDEVAFFEAFFYHYRDNGGIHWNASFAIPNWFLVIVFSAVFAFVFRRRSPKIPEE